MYHILTLSFSIKSRATELCSVEIVDNNTNLGENDVYLHDTFTVNKPKVISLKSTRHKGIRYKDSKVQTT